MKGIWQTKVSGFDSKGNRRKKHKESDLKKDKAKLIRRKKYDSITEGKLGFISGKKSMSNYKRFFNSAERQKTKEAISHENYEHALDGKNRKCNKGSIRNKPSYYNIYTNKAAPV